MRTDQDNKTVARMLELDCFRGLAALSVVLFHYTAKFDELYVHSGSLLIYFPNGSYGVNLFFVISGFVIFMTLDNTKRELDFVVSRFSRLFPAYWAAVPFTFLVVTLLGLPGKEVSLGEAFVNLTMFQEYFRVRHVDNVYWTLQVEIQFYLFMLALYHYRWLVNIERIVIAWLSLSFVHLAALKIVDMGIPFILSKILILPFFPFFAIGMMFYMIRRDKTVSLQRGMIIAAAAVTAAISEVALGLIAVACSLLFYLFVTDRLRFMVHPVLVFLGTISYSLYLIHENVGWAVLRRLQAQGMDPNLTVLVTLVGAIIAASVLNRLIEMPAMKYIRVSYRRRRQRDEMTKAG